MTRPSPFLYAPPTADADSLAILHLKRDSLLPVQLQATADDGYAEGAVTNTRFGSFPHSTLIGLEWGSQVRASKVDTGSRGRKGKKVKQADHQGGQTGEQQKLERDTERALATKRKSGDPPEDLPEAKRVKSEHAEAVRNPLEAGSGFIHILPPTPEAWTSSLDHRTQVVYTPDYSFILQRLRVRPGCRIIEAGAGSGSFTHAAARAVFNGYPGQDREPQDAGKVYSFEYHEPRVHTLRDEIVSHGLDGIVELTHRDVYNDAFVLQDGTPPSVDAVFLDLPAPWHALKHLSRSAPNSPLNPHNAIHLCTFSPCIEQVMATCSFLRKAGWTDISMFEVQHRRIDVRRERVGLKEEGLRGVSATAASVSEAIGRLREVENKLSAFHNLNRPVTNANDREDVAQEKKSETKSERLQRIKREADERKLYKEGNLVTRTEAEVKTHTSYLVFAVLPRKWTEDDEAALEQEYPVDEIMKGAPKAEEAK
ncbi:tRNA (adenine(58)-N(1))-methyltransferase catalytic subunit trm61 [Lecanosticta acicola]|uniref:tRNA (adenine(58)-N(1))-methyltransferase catalytic subunit TRM61 n=1 Tax=Lecanosticta acicola TaxID=111012 RepID=A0AAI8Z8U2_9PEZI|nr:tRNA (adenine(58)-N(1))-methyltransferase catalytic subunit trm61 [Lecanosticta acicola]